MFGTLKGLDQSMNPQLMKYGRETDVSIAQGRREHRKRLFAGYQSPNKATNIENVEPYREQFGQRILIKCDSLKFRLQAPIDGEKESLCQVEPYITSLALYDAKAGRKLTENFYFDINHEQIRELFEMNPGEGCCTPNGSADMVEQPILPKQWLAFPKQAIMSITAHHPDVFLVVKIDKILQGGIHNSTEPYLKATKDPKLGLKLHRNVKTYHQKIGHFRMPFAWAARPLFRLYSSELDTAIEFPAIYRQESGRLKDEDLLKLLSEYRKPDKFSKLTSIPGWLKISIEPLTELPNSMKNSNYYLKNMFVMNSLFRLPHNDIGSFETVSNVTAI